MANVTPMASGSRPPTISSLRLLILAPISPPSSPPPFAAVLAALTGSRPGAEVVSFAGYTTHAPLRLRTKYYDADVNIWCDEIPGPDPANPLGDHQISSQAEGDLGTTDRATPLHAEPDPDSDLVDADVTTLAEWRKQMLSAAAADVRAVIGGILLVLPLASAATREVVDGHLALLDAVHALRDAIEDESLGRDVASIALVQASSAVTRRGLTEATDALEDGCVSDRGILGWDIVGWQDALPSGSHEEGGAYDARNEYGEKTGMARVVEVLHGIDWTVAPDWQGDDDDGDASDAWDPSMRRDLSHRILDDAQGTGMDDDFEQEMRDLKLAMLDAGDETAPLAGPEPQDEQGQVEQLQHLMDRVVAIRDAGSDLPPAERERFAKRQVERLLREMGE